MLHFLYPIGLTAMAGILFPVVLHLWNDRRGKVLRIGSIFLLQGASRRMAVSRKLSERLLLVIRCLLLLLLALLLAGPYWQRSAGGEKRKGWVLVAAGAGVYGTLIDSLVKAGYERHVLGDTAGTGGAGVNYWEEFRNADKNAPAGADLFVFSTGLAGRYAGVRPVTGRTVHWYTYSPVDSVSHWTEGMWLSAFSRDSVRVSEGNSRATGTGYHFENSLRGGQGADTGYLSVTVYTDPVFRPDGRYLTAAMRALGSFTERRIRINVIDRVPAGVDTGWLFWLSVRPLPPGRWGHVWRYAAGRDTALDSWMEGVEVMKEVIGISEGGVWKDGYGRGVLRRDGTVYQFYSRLDPAWNGLVWDRKFPVLLGKLLLGEDSVPVLDRRVLDPGQVAPVPVAGVRGAGEKADFSGAGVIRTDLRPALWVLLFILFIMERVVSFATTAQKKDG